jgi:serine-type D-Ala-D-Ala carboxypeptidase/endopeptidase
VPVRGRPITLGDLATHTAGLSRLPHGFFLRSVRHRRNPYAWFTVDDLYAGLPATRLRRAPGGRPRYSNLGYGLLGHVLALRASCGYEQLVQERICRPLGLEDTGVAVAAAARDRFAPGHSRRGRPVPHWDLPGLAGAGALRSTVADLLAFLRLQLGEGDPALARAAALTHAPRARQRRVAVGLGWMRMPLLGTDHELLFHNGGTGGFRSFAGFVPATHTAVVVLSNCARSVDAPRVPNPPADRGALAVRTAHVRITRFATRAAVAGSARPGERDRPACRAHGLREGRLAWRTGQLSEACARAGIPSGRGRVLAACTSSPPGTRR